LTAPSPRHRTRAFIDATLETERDIARTIGRKDLAALKAILTRITVEGG
jgi:hypothetical protein